jgi:5S rRNA maturation endonuclease (ribonuclease M5)
MTPESTPTKRSKPAISAINFQPSAEDLIAHLKAKQNGSSYWSLCPAHDDHKPSLELTIADRGFVWVKCRTGCSIDNVRSALPPNLQQLVRESGASASPAVAKATKATKKKKAFGTNAATYNYCDASGNIVYRVVRTANPKGFYQQRPDGVGGWIGNLAGTPPTIYHLPEVLMAAKAGEVIFIAEGEKDVDALVSVGVVATCNSGGAEKFRSEFGDYFTGAKEVVVVADNDVPGMKHAQQIMAFMTAWSIPVRVVRAAEGKDFSDHLAAGFGISDLVPVLDSELPAPSLLTLITPNADDDEPPSPTQLMVLHVLSSYDLGCDGEGSPWAVPKKGEPRIAIPIEEHGKLARRLVGNHWRSHFFAPSKSAAAAACMQAHDEAERSSTLIEPALRATFADGCVIIDLGRQDGQVLTIRPGEWSVGPDTHNVVWRRTKLTGEMPIPGRGGDINLLRNHVRVGDQDWPATVAWLILALRPDLPCPIIITRGPAGAAKSSLARRLLDLVDPAGGGRSALRSVPRDVESWSVSANASRAIGIDNLTGIPAWWKSALCIAVTGAIDTARALYTDSDITIRFLKKSIILTGIDVGTLTSDLADRTISIELEAIPDTERADESQLDAAWQRDQAAILGGLADVIAKMLAIPTSTIPPDTKPRMSDFYTILLGVDQVLGTDGAQSYLTSARDLQSEIADGEPVVQAIASLMDGRDKWKAAMTELYSTLTPADPSKRWPQSAQALSGKIKALEEPLKTIGIGVDRPRGTGGVRQITFFRIVTLDQTPVALFDGGIAESSDEDLFALERELADDFAEQFDEDIDEGRDELSAEDLSAPEDDLFALSAEDFTDNFVSVGV